MKKYWILLAAALLCACNKPADDRNKVVITPPRELQKFEASVRTNYQIYQANPKLFGSSSQLKGIQNRLDEIKALGTDILYIMPIYPEGKKDAFGSPYCIKDYTAVNSACGSLDDVKALVKAAHSKGMKVMLDWVANHTAWDHAWRLVCKERQRENHFPCRMERCSPAGLQLRRPAERYDCRYEILDYGSRYRRISL